MQPEKILESDSLDILFEHRNKEYGAYDLRKKYNKRLLLAMAMGLLVISIPTVFIGLEKYDKLVEEKPQFKTELFISHTINLDAPLPKPKKQNLPLPALKKTKPAISNNNGQIKIVKEDFIAKIVEVKSPAFSHTTGVTGSSIDVPDENRGGGESTSEIIKEIPVALVDINTPLPVAEQMPAYPGGLKALRKFLENNLESPRPLDEGEKINVQVKFIVGYDGNLKSFELVKDGGAVFNKEVMRVLKLMPKWIPGKNAGKNVSVYFSLPVSFVAPE